MTSAELYVAVLAIAVESDIALVTVAGSPNDIVWGILADAGIMEASDVSPSVAQGNLVGWRLTPAGRSALSNPEMTNG